MLAVIYTCLRHRFLTKQRGVELSSTLRCLVRETGLVVSLCSTSSLLQLLNHLFPAKIANLPAVFQLKQNLFIYLTAAGSASPISNQKQRKVEQCSTLRCLVRMAIQNFLKKPVISMVLGLSDNKFSCF